MTIENLPVVICYPAGAGGSMLGSALQSVLTGRDFKISNTGNCHNNAVVSIPNYIPSSDYQGICNELSVLKLVNLHDTLVVQGHLRNLVALHSMYYNFWFIKITFNPDLDNEVKFLHEMLIKKMPMENRLKKHYDQIKDDRWPSTIDMFLKDNRSEDLFAEQNYHTLRNWFWVESQSTKTRTVELSLQDIFLGIPSEKLSAWYNDDIVDKLYPLVKSWQTINNKLYPKTLALLTS
jgi:hypothetical protein